MKDSQTSILKPLSAAVIGIALSACTQLPTQETDDTAAQEIRKSTSDYRLPQTHEDFQPPAFPSQEDSALSSSQPAAKQTVPKQNPPSERFDHNDLWQVLGNNFYLTDQNDGRFDAFIQLYAKQTRHIETLSARAKPFLHYIYFEVNKRNMPLEIALLPMVESGFRSHAHSSSSASGLWQFMPSTAHIYELKQDWWYDGRRDLIDSTKAALDYLTRLNQVQDGDWLLALASYNAGMGTVARAKAKYRKQVGDDKAKVDFWKIRRYLPKETQNYVPKLLAYAHLIEHSTEFGIKLEPIENKGFFNIVRLSSPTAIPIEKIAEVSKTPAELLSLLNASYLRPLTPPKNRHDFLLPKENSHLLINALKKNPELFHSPLQIHKVTRGETLSGIARKYQLDESVIKKFNPIKNNRLRIGQKIKLPIPKDYALKINQTFFESDKEFHRVKTGESLWLIAQHYNTSSHALAQMNGIRLNAPIRNGQLLRVRAPNNQSAKRNSAKIKGKTLRHRVNKGDSLWTLARLYKTNISELREL
ncbi:LysM peptidoglycan-binding domain-containing protein, partial [Thiomicrorhabdus sp.]|uniref:LysM peptidoglycan-binding domain-containing protein n=1 Tax=Thiomicrorhabdus sp. TaxID=2039724 RepID=UPI0029C9A2BE